MPARVVVLGGGVGGTLAANLLSKGLGRDAKVTVVDPTGMHVYQPGFLYVALGQGNGRWLARDERTLLRKDVELAVEAAGRVDADSGIVHMARGGSLPYDYLVLATGARLVPYQVPGLVEGAYEFYSLEGAQRLREALRRFRGGRILVGIAGIPYKCPPAPVEFVMMLEEYLRKRGIRERSEVTLLSPLNRAFTIESASKLVQPIMEERGIGLTTFFNVEAVDPSAGVVASLEGEKAEYDLLVLVPPHRGQKVIEDSGLERVHRPLRGAGGDEPDRVADPRHQPEDQLPGQGHVLLRDRERPGDGAQVRLRASADASAAVEGVARGEVDVQPPVLGDRAPGPDPGAAAEGRERSMGTAIAKTLDLKGLSGNELIEQTEEGGVFRFLIKKR